MITPIDETQGASPLPVYGGYLIERAETFTATQGLRSDAYGVSYMVSQIFRHWIHMQVLSSLYI